MNLQPVDFKAVAAKGAYVYCYLREHDRTPYYIGISENKNGRRPYELHSCWHPPYDALVRLMRSGLDIETAKEWERFYIKRYGIAREKGLLKNRTYGGDGVHGMQHSEKTKARLKEAGFAFKATSIKEQTQEVADQLEANGNCLASEYQAMTYKDRQAFRKFLERNPKGTIEQWGSQSHSEYSRRGAMNRSKAAAARVGAPFEKWCELSDSDKSAVKAWLKRNPKGTFADWIAGKRQKRCGPRTKWNAA